MMNCKTLWVFDVDGVLTHPSEKRVTQRGLFTQMKLRLEKGDLVALNTGRPLAFIEREIFEPLANLMGGVDAFENFISVAEKGAVWETFDTVGHEIHIDEQYSVPIEIQNTVRELVRTTFRDIAFYDEGKQAMATVEMNDGHDVEEFWRRQKELNIQMNSLLERFDMSDQYIVDPSRIATDIQAVGTGKHLGARRISDWMRTKGCLPEKVVCFGDGISDVAMAEEFAEQGYDTTFVYVGGKGHLDEYEDKGFELIYTEKNCEEGTLEYLLGN